MTVLDLTWHSRSWISLFYRTAMRFRISTRQFPPIPKIKKIILWVSVETEESCLKSKVVELFCYSFKKQVHCWQNYVVNCDYAEN